MNLLIDTLPDSVQVGGVAYPVHVDFRNWIRFDMVMFEGRLDIQQRAMKALGLCYRRQLPPDLEQALQGAVDFYACRTGEAERLPEAKEGAAARRIYSFAHDSAHIYAAFWEQYGIDLQVTKLHWWAFRALFAALGEDTKICRIMEYRAADLSQIKDKQQKDFYRRAKAMYRLPDWRSEQQKEADMIAQLQAFF